MAFSKAFVAVFVALGALGANAGPYVLDLFGDFGLVVYRDFYRNLYWNYNGIDRYVKLDYRGYLFRGIFELVRDSGHIVYWNYNGFDRHVEFDSRNSELSSTLETSSTAVSTATTSQGPIRTQECAVLGGAGHDLSQDKLAEVKIDAYDDKTLDECLAICASQRDCATLAHNPTQNRCETWKGTLEQIGVEDTPRAEWYYYSTSCLANDRKDTCARPGWGLDGDENTSRTKIGKFPNYDNYASCYAFCEETGGCAMFAFNPVEQLCELWSGSFEQAKFKPVFRASWTFYRLDCLEPEGGAN
ncbi:hypothetical protein ACHAPT_011535 [Fusarium lateritium]